MSVATCDGCDTLIDTDEDCECYCTVIIRNMDETLVGKHEKCLCGACRDNRWYEIEDFMDEEQLGEIK